MIKGILLITLTFIVIALLLNNKKVERLVQSSELKSIISMEMVTFSLIIVTVIAFGY